ncbi:hypothetical protein CYLTODRAFT_426387 [Cylindrobasidium torrendii FP15055 ss-10]|uniref:Uncharacterized protein n=1 Tax=Cylindrobasidium torrendii FP15055 ss-10 TaxID=1314674 RepID=A0A0D7B0Q2_9AGAR|nr:hypothetical protein CYLTODRAFT_426387 [Cylindrobasidium torrendii FP15055 ss-10]
MDVHHNPWGKGQPYERKDGKEYYPPWYRGTERTKTKRVYPRMICGLHIEADEAQRWCKAEWDMDLEEDHSSDSALRLFLDTHLEEEIGFGEAVYVSRPDVSYYDFLAVTDEFSGEFETDNPINDHLVTDEKHLVSGDTPNVDRMRAILDELKIRYTGFRCYYRT